MSAEKKNNIQLVRQAFQAINTGDISKASEFISPRYFNHESQMDPVRSKMRGPEEFIDTVKNLREAISDIRYEELETIASDSKIVSIVNVTGKHTGTFLVLFRPRGTRYPIKPYISIQSEVMERSLNTKQFETIWL
jgi:ketosteroid isomerase-like protein